MRPALLALALACAATTAACGKDSSPRATRLSATDAERALVDRNWMTSWPQSKREQLQVYRFTPSMGGGVFQDRTLYKGSFELFRFTVGDGTIEFDFPETREERRCSFLVERVTNHPPFDLKLTIADDPRGKGVYWGRSDERDQGADPAAALLLQ